LAREESQRRLEDRRDMQAFLQAALTAFIAVNSNIRNQDGNNQNWEHNNDPSAST
jgi:hypothetical protein